jgi:hypothetical protein
LPASSTWLHPAHAAPTADNSGKSSTAYGGVINKLIIDLSLKDALSLARVKQQQYYA